MRPPVDAGSAAIRFQISVGVMPAWAPAPSAPGTGVELDPFGRTKTAEQTGRSPLESDGRFTRPRVLSHIVVPPPPSRFIARTAPSEIISFANPTSVMPT